MSTELEARVAALSVAQRAKLLQALYQGSKQQPLASPTTYPLYDMQRVFWAAQSLDPSSWAYNVGFLFELSAPYRGDLLQKAVAAVVARHGALRTVYSVSKTGPTQTVLESGLARVEDIDAMQVKIGMRVKFRAHPGDEKQPPYPVFTPTEAK